MTALIISNDRSLLKPSPDQELLDLGISVKAIERLKELGLTPREISVLRCIADGYSNVGISERLHIGPHTVENHITLIKQKFGIFPDPRISRSINGRVQLVVLYHTAEG